MPSSNAGASSFAVRRLADLVRDIDLLDNTETAQITFEELAARWIEAERHTLKESSTRRREGCVKFIAPAFFGLQIRNITANHCADWAIDRAKVAATATFTKELETMRGAFRYATALGLILRDPSANIKRPRVRNKPPDVPTREQFEKIVASIRAEPQGKDKDGADLVELLDYSGMRCTKRFLSAGATWIFAGKFYRDRR
jgi:site-specific recombinase XerD